jgi:hypothetical protein
MIITPTSTPAIDPIPPAIMIVNALTIVSAPKNASNAKTGEASAPDSPTNAEPRANVMNDTCLAPIPTMAAPSLF